MTKKERIYKILISEIQKKNQISNALLKLNLNGNICEIGVRNGNNFSNLYLCNPNKIVAVDIWSEIPGKPEFNDANYKQKELDKQYNDFHANWANKKNVVIIRDFSIKAAKKFSDKYFDFIYIDAAHTYEEVLKDLIAWYPKLKIGGILSGHDYIQWEKKSRGTYFGVYRAVNQFVNLMKLKVDHTTSDHESYPSYFIINYRNSEYLSKIIGYKNSTHVRLLLLKIIVESVSRSYKLFVIIKSIIRPFFYLLKNIMKMVRK